MWSEFAKIKGAKIILHVKSPKFRADKLKGFTVLSSKKKYKTCKNGIGLSISNT